MHTHRGAMPHHKKEDEMSQPENETTAPPVPDAPDAGGFKSPESKDAVLADLATERAERKRLAAQLQSLTEALGGDPKVKDFDPAREIAHITRRLDVAELARVHGVTQDDDLAVLASIDDPAVRAKAAARFAAPAPAATDSGSGPAPKPETFPRPKPDATQGPKGEPERPDPAPGVPRMAAAFDAQLGTA